MRHLQKPQISTEDILKDCVASYRKETRDGIKNRLHVSISVILVCLSATYHGK